MESVTPETESVMKSDQIALDLPGCRDSLSVTTQRKNFGENALTNNEENIAFENDAQDSEGSDMEKKEEIPVSVSPAVVETIKSHENDKALKTMTDQISEATKEEDDISQEIQINGNEEKRTKTAKKRGRKLKKTSEKRTAFDGRKVVFVTECTQTDWNWKDKAEKSGKSTILSASFDNVSRTSSRSATQKSIHAEKSDSNLGQTQIDGESRPPETKTITDLTPFYLIPDDEFGIPVMELSSDSESSGGESYQEPKHYRHHLPSVGPPLILRYIRESDTIEKTTEKTEGILDEELNQQNFKGPVTDEKEPVSLVGMFSGICEFCGVDIKPFPSLDQQLSQPPESLYCCEDYREFVEFATTTAARLEEDVMKKSQQISVKVHAHHGSLQERQLAKERAVLRLHEREVQRRQQEARGMQAAFNQSSTAGQISVTAGGINEHQTDETLMFKDMDSQILQKDLRESEDAADENVAIQNQSGNREKLVEVIRGDKKQINLRGEDEEMLVEGEAAMNGIKEGARREQRGKRKKGGFGRGAKGGIFGGNSGEREGHHGKKGSQIGGGPFTHHFSLRMSQGPGTSYSSLGSLNIQDSQILQKDLRESEDAADENVAIQNQSGNREKLVEVIRGDKKQINLRGEDEEMLVEGEAAMNGIKEGARREQRGKRKKGGFGRGAKGGIIGGNSGEREGHHGKKGSQIGGGPFTHHFSLRMSQGPGTSYSSLGSLNIQVGRQMKTINYQLSSRRCLEEGWTLRAPSPMDDDDVESEIFIPEPLNAGMIAAGQLQRRPMIEKFYPNGSKFLTIFPDGTGNVFYPSGRLSILIVSTVPGQNTYIVHDDCDDPALLAVFEPNGYGCCYFANGKIRLTYDQIGGLELDYAGGRKRSWTWKDQETHVHAPPFQPIVFGMNNYLGIRFMAQENIALTLTGRKRSCRFNVGAKLKVVASENIQPKGVDEHQLIICEHRVKVQTILDKMSNLLKFPKSPKVDLILPSLSVSVRKQKVDKMKLTLHSSQKLHKTVKQIQLPPLGSSAV